jgi:hypothetical protein
MPVPRAAAEAAISSVIVVANFLSVGSAIRMMRSVEFNVLKKLREVHQSK